MGDWRRVQIVGSCSDSYALNRHLDVKSLDDESMDRFGPLSHTGGICGLSKWASRQIDVIGNLAERGYDEESIQEHLVELSKIDPSLAVKVHMGVLGEGDEVEYTIVLAGGYAVAGPPEVETIPPLDKSLMQNNLMAALRGQRF